MVVCIFAVDHLRTDAEIAAAAFRRFRCRILCFSGRIRHAVRYDRLRRINLDLDKIKHIVDLAGARDRGSVAVDHDFLNIRRNDVILGRLDIEILSFFQRSDALVNVIEHINILIVICGNQNIAFLCCLRTDSVLRKHDEVRVLVLVKIDDLRLLKIRCIFLFDLLNCAVVGSELKRLAKRQTRSAGQYGSDREARRKLRNIRTECAVYIFARRSIKFDAVYICRAVLVDKRNEQLCSLALR